MLNIYGLNSQGATVPGYKAPLVTDTMEDMLCNFSGGILFCIQFLIGRLTKFSFGIKFYEHELCYKRFIKGDFPKQSEEDANKKQEGIDEEEKSIEENSKINNDL